jgi:CubicO group peptidase (beta-lactamase class C family)
MEASRVRNLFRFSAVLILTSLFAAHAGAQRSSALTPATIAKVDSAVEAFRQKSGAPGVSIALVQDGVLVYAKGYGFADLENSVPATSETLYRLASVSKTITAVAAMQLWQQHKLDLDAPIQKYCPAFPDKGSLITTRELLGHLGGIRHYKEGDAGLPELNNTIHFADPIAGGISLFKDDPLVAKPGAHFHYSTQGYTLVGCAIASASGESYVDFVREHIFTPVGMSETVVDDRFAVIPHRTRFYSKAKDGKIQNSEFLDSSYKIPGGGWLSSATDLANYEIALMKGKLVDPATLALMSTPRKPSDGSEDRYGLGFGVDPLEVGGNKFMAIGHSGGQQGTSTMILLVPAMNTAVVVLANLDGAESPALAKDLEKILLEAK